MPEFYIGNVRGPQGAKGESFTFNDFTPEQLESLRGPRGLQGEPGEFIAVVRKAKNNYYLVKSDKSIPICKMDRD